MIEFDYNSHLIEECKQFADKLGFKFKIRRSRLRHRLKDKNKNLSNRQKKIVKNLTPSLPAKDEVIDIECEWKKKDKISVDYTSRLWMCCYFSSFYHHKPTSVNDKSQSKDIRRQDGLDHYINQYENEWNFLNNYTLKEILDHKFFTVDLEKSFLNTEEFPVIKRCVKHCNSEVREADKLIYGDAQTSYEKAISR